MKKILAMLLASLMLVAMTSCDKTPNEPNTPDTPGGNETGNESESVNGEKLETSLWSLVYDKAVWTVSPDDIYNDEDYCGVSLQIPNPEDEESYLIYVEIEASLDDPYDFRDDLAYYGFDLREYADGKYTDLTKIGGVDCLKYENEGFFGNTLRYFNRIENAGATINVTIDAADVTDSRIGTLLNGLTFTLTDVGNEDGPWEWEGTPFSAENKTATVGSLTLSATWVPFKDYIGTRETFDHAVAAVGNTVYVLTDGVLKEYAFDGAALTFTKDIALPEDDYDTLLSTDDGSLWVCGSMNDVIRLKDGAVAATYEDMDYFAVAPSGQWGVNYFTSNECQKVTLSGDSATTSLITFAEVDTINYIRIENDAIYICGNAADDSGHKVFIYNTDGALQKTLCDENGEGLGSITFITKTANGYLGFDGNMREVVLWDANGGYIGAAEDTDLFSTDYPWFCSSTLLSDGRILTVMTDTRADQSATELIAFVVSGF